MDNKQLGQFGENVVVDYLLDKGYKILGRNYEKVWSSRFKGEIDIIAKKDKTISFVEVKTSQGFYSDRSEGFCPEDRVNFEKQKKLIRLARAWLEEKNILVESLWQIDVASVLINKENNPEINYFENVVCES